MRAFRQLTTLYSPKRKELLALDEPEHLARDVSLGLGPTAAFRHLTGTVQAPFDTTPQLSLTVSCYSEIAQLTKSALGRC